MKIEELKRQMLEAEKELASKVNTREKVSNKLGIIALVLIAIIGFKIVILMTRNEGYNQAKEEYEQQIRPAHADTVVQSDQIPDAGEMVSTSAPELEQVYSSNSIYNWPYAVDIWNDCKINVNFYNDWSNWYGEESAMRMCLITKAENGTRASDRIGYNTNGSRDVGFFQINSVHCGKVSEALHSDACVTKLQDLGTNVNVARQIYEAQGWSPWVAKNAYLPDFWADRLTIN
jgi:hypothetical protein